MKKRLSVLLLVLLMLSAFILPALAADMPPAMPMDGGAPPPMPGEGGGGGPAAAGQEFATFEEVRSHAGILVENGTVTEAPQESDFSGLMSKDETAKITPTGISGLILDGKELANGIAIEMASGEEVFTIGGEETPNKADGKK